MSPKIHKNHMLNRRWSRFAWKNIDAKIDNNTDLPGKNSAPPVKRRGCC